jgi:hypothetical protein
MPPGSNLFRLNARYFFLTYSQATIQSDDLWTFLKEKGVISATIAQERHQDGEPHIHCVGKFDRKKNIKDCKYFDFKDYHPNIQSPRNIKATLDYIKKDGNFKEYGESSISSQSKWTNIIQSSTSSTEFINLITELEPRTAICNFNQVRAFAEYTFRKPPKAYESPFNTFINIRPEMDSFHSELLRPRNPSIRDKGLVIIGPTRLGKTAWARSLGTHTYFCGQLNWDRHSTDARYAIIDDVPMQYITKKTQIFGCQQEFETAQKYQKVKSISWGIPVIYLTNNDHFLKDEPEWFIKWFEDNMYTITIFDKLYQ